MTYIKHYASLTFLLYVVGISEISCSGSCDPGWTETTNMCLRFSPVEMYWNAAVQECRKFDAVLYQFFKSADKSEFDAVAETQGSDRWWTAMNDLNEEGIWMWGTGLQAINIPQQFLRWNVEPNDVKHKENCGAMNIQLAFSDQRCSDRHGYICEETPSQGVNCTDSTWVKFGPSCYYFSDVNNAFDLFSWSDAVSNCKYLVQNSHLINIESQTEMNYLTKQLPMTALTSQLWWTGLNDENNEGHYVWSDGTAAATNILSWQAEPNNLGGGERCGVIYFNGRFGDLNCSQAEKYICMKQKDPNRRFIHDVGCPKGWVRAGHSCYFIDNKGPMLSWQDSRSKCTALGGDLLSVDTEDEKSWVKIQTERFPKDFWSGLNDKQKMKDWRWADNSKAISSLIQWTQEPNNYMSREDCAVMLQNGALNDVSCLHRYGFICEAETEDRSCPSGWISKYDEDEVNCYFISNTTATRDEALAQCNHRSFPISSYLLALNSQDESDFIFQSLNGRPPVGLGWFTGLNDVQQEGIWLYDTDFNNPPNMDLIQWDSFPQYRDGTEHCVTIYTGGLYINRNCDTKAYYMCEKTAVVNTLVYTTPTLATRTEIITKIVHLNSACSIRSHLVSVLISLICVVRQHLL